MEFVKKHKNDLLVFCGIFVFALITCSNFMQKHYATDTYVLMSGGYTPYIDRFLASSRPISAIALFLARTLQMSYGFYIVLMDIIGVIALSLSVFALYFTIIKLVKKEGIKEHLFFHMLVLIIAFFTIFNFCSIEELLFAESAVMCMGILFSVLAASSLVLEKKYRYLLRIICLKHRRIMPSRD